jgi:hypothetical protein
MTIKLVGSTSGSVALDAPASTTSGADVAFKLPVADGSANQLLKTDGSGQLGWASDSAGKILQVVSASTTSGTTTSSTTPVDTGLTATITPTASSSKILVFATGQLGHSRDYSGQGSGAHIIRTISSTATTIYSANEPTHLYFDNGQMVATNIRGNWSTMVEDSPSTTSACVYKVQIEVYISSNGGAAYFNSTNTGKAWMHLMEVAA